MWASLKLFFEWLKKLCRDQVYLRKETLQPAQVALTKMPRNEAKIYQETYFLSTEGHLLTSSGCLTGRCTGLIYVCRDLFITYLISKLYYFADKCRRVAPSSLNYDMAGS